MSRSRFQSGSGGAIRGLQLTLVIISTLLAAAVVGSAAHVYHSYKTQQANYNPWWLPIWTGHFDTSGVKTTIGTASGVLILNLVFLALLFVPKFKSMNKVGAFTAGGVSVPCILLAIAGIVVSSQASRKDRFDTIETWACKWKGVQGLVSAGHDESNGNFGSMCTESSFSFWGMVTVLCLQTLLLGSSVAQCFVGRSSNDSFMSNEKISEVYVPSSHQ